MLCITGFYTRALLLLYWYSILEGPGCCQEFGELMNIAALGRPELAYERSLTGAIFRTVLVCGGTNDLTLRLLVTL